MSRYRKNPEKHASEFVSGQLRDDIRKMMNNRWKLMAPFPVPAIDIWRLAWTPAHHTAFKILNGTFTLRKYRKFELTGFKDEEQEEFKIGITLEDDQPMPREFTMGRALLTDEQNRLIDEWIPVWWRYKTETESLCQKVYDVANQCSTYGQIIRLWPDLLGFLGEYGKEKIANAKVRSPYPEGVLKWGGYVEESDGGKRIRKVSELEDYYKPAAFEPFTNMIAECLMLPVIDDLIHVGEIDYN